MEKKYYYTNLLAAAWMSENHKMRFRVLVIDHGKPSFYEWYPYMITPHGCSENIYIHPDSLHILKPQVGDLIYGPDHDIYGICETVETSLDFFDREHPSHKEDYSPEDYVLEEQRLKQEYSVYLESGEQAFVPEVIRRNGISFMWPEVENA